MSRPTDLPEDPIEAGVAAASLGFGLSDARSVMRLAATMDCAPKSVLRRVELAASAMTTDRRYWIEVSLALGEWADSGLKLSNRIDEAAARKAYNVRTGRRKVRDARKEFAAALAVQSPVPNTPVGALGALELSELVRSSGPLGTGCQWVRWLTAGQFSHLDDEPLAEYVAGLAQARDLILKRASIDETCRVLDLGCGLGFLTDAARRLAARGEVLAVDASADAIDLLEAAMRTTCEEGMGRVATLCASIGDLAEVEDSSIDRVLIHNVLTHVDWEELNRAIDEVHRVLSLGGRFAIFEPLNSSATLAQERFAEVLDPALVPNYRKVCDAMGVGPVDASSQLQPSSMLDVASRMVEVGFSEVAANVDMRSVGARRLAPSEVDHLVEGQPCPLARSYREAAGIALCDAAMANRHVAAVRACISRSAVSSESAGLLVWGTR